jgi:hypothetical protein
LTHLKTAGILNVEEAEWQDPPQETVDTEGKAKVATAKCTGPRNMEINNRIENEILNDHCHNLHKALPEMVLKIKSLSARWAWHWQ